MERSGWLKQMRSMAERLYDKISPQYWVTFGLHENETHLTYLQKFLERIAPGGMILSAGCGAGRYDGLLLDAGHSVVGIDQSEGMLKRAREHFPMVHYEKVGLQEMNFRGMFDGIICMEVLEHVSPEDYPNVLQNFHQALKMGGVLYFTVDINDPRQLEGAYKRAKKQGLPVVYGEVVDKVNTAYAQVEASDLPVSGDLSDLAVYHFYPSLHQVREWTDYAGLTIQEEGEGSGYHHFIAIRETT